MNLINKADVFFMKILVRPILNRFEKWTGVTPFILSWLIAACGIVSIPFSAIPASFETAELLGEFRHLGIYIVVPLAIFHFLYLLHIMKKAKWRWLHFLDKDLHTIPEAGVIYDTRRPVWFIFFPLVIIGVCIMPRFDGITFPLIPTFFFWPALVVCGVEPYYAADRKNQRKRIYRLFLSFIFLLVFGVLITHLILADMNIRSPVLLFTMYGILLKMTIQVITKKD